MSADLAGQSAANQLEQLWAEVRRLTAERDALRAVAKMAAEYVEVVSKYPEMAGECWRELVKALDALAPGRK